jgi:hypothetical protein
MPEKLKLYTASMLAFSPLADYEGKGPGVYVEQIPALFLEGSIESVVEKARKQALAKWPLGQGWYSHQLAVLPITKEFNTNLFNAYRGGGVDMESEPGQGQVFNLS